MKMNGESGLNRNRIYLVAVMLCFSVVVTTSLAADWPMWRNERSNAGSSSENIALPLTPVWHSAAPHVEENGAVVAGGIAYMLTEDGWLNAFQVSTGFEVAGFPVRVGGSYSTPAVDVASQKVYALTSDGNLYAFNLDGSSAWTTFVGSVGTNFNEGPIIDDGYVYVAAGGTLKKFNAAGSLQWSSEGAGLDTQPSIMGANLYLNTEVGQIRKYDKLTGAQVVGSGFPIVTAPSQSALTTVNGRIFHKADRLYAYNASNGSLLWSEYDGGQAHYYGSPAVSGGAVYVYGWDGRLYAFDENTGDPLAGFPSVNLGSSDRNWGSPSVAGDKIFIGAGETQRLKVLGAAGSAQAGQVLDQYPTFSTDPQGFDLCSPIISDGYVFAMLDGGGLYVFYGGTITDGTLIINAGATCTDTREVVLTLASDGTTVVQDMRISEDPLLGNASWEPYSSTRTWTLSQGFGQKTVYAQYRYSTGALSVVFSDQIDYLAACLLITLTPREASNPVGTPHTVYAAIQDTSGAGQSGHLVAFSILSGPNFGASGTCMVNADCRTTDPNGQVSFTYTGTGGVGRDEIRACFTSQSGSTICTPNVTKDWILTDCNHNGIVDDQDIRDGTSQDCQPNGVPDECDIAAGTSQDLNGDAVPDECTPKCPNPPVIECTEDHPCDSLEPGLQCPADASVLTDTVSAEPTDSEVCGGSRLLVFHTRQGSFVATEPSTGEVCSSECFGGCYESCVTVPIQRCYENCVRRCANGVCLQWETKCDVVRTERDCDTTCFSSCGQNFDPITQTSFYTRHCGHALHDVYEVRVADGHCGGTLLDSISTDGFGTVTASIPAPLTPGVYELCLAGEIVKTFGVRDCGSTCRIQARHGGFMLQRGSDDTLDFEIESRPSGGTFEFSLVRYEDDAHKVNLPVPAFLSIPPPLEVPPGVSTPFTLAVVNPQPAGAQLHWGNVILVADGPAHCETVFDVDVSPNQPPIIECRNPIKSTDLGRCTAVVPCEQIAACTDPDGDPVTTTCTPEGPYGLGQTGVTVNCEDGHASSSVTCPVLVEDREPPVVTCPANILPAECTGPGGASVPYPPPTVTDNCGGALPVSCVPPSGSTFPIGTTPVTCGATDPAGNQAACGFGVTVQDTTPPVLLELGIDPMFLWPPNHTMRDVGVNYTTADLCSPVTCSLSVTSNEPVNGTGDGDTAPDWFTVDDHHLELRAERAGTGTGRTYGTRLVCSDASGNSVPATLPDVRVIHDMRSPASGSAFRINTSVKFAGTFLDVPGKTHTATWAFDGLTAPGVLTEPTSTKVGTVTGTKTFTAAGVYAVSMNVKDNLGTTGTANAVGGMDAIVVIYDPSGGYVTGGGWIDSPPGAYKADPALSGKVSFGFVSKYFKNATNPKGETDFGFRVGNFRFNALNFDYLMISGAKAMYKGSGKVNGSAGYGFILTVIDGQAPNGGGVDKFRMKIWNKNTGAIVFDNQMGAPDNADPITPAGAGSSIVIQP